MIVVGGTASERCDAGGSKSYLPQRARMRRGATATGYGARNGVAEAAKEYKESVRAVRSGRFSGGRVDVVSRWEGGK